MSVDVLIVDDDTDMRDVLRELLQDAGLRTSELPDASKLAETLDRIRPRLVLLDLTLPGADLRGALSTARARGFLVGTKVFAVSGLTDADLIADELGLDGVVPKPFDTAALLKRVNAICRLAESERSVEVSSARI